MSLPISKTGKNSLQIYAKCILCNGSHFLDQCSIFLGKTVLERYDVAKGHKLCIKCFRSNHVVSNCRSTFKCHTCGNNRNTLLHHRYSTMI